MCAHTHSETWNSRIIEKTRWSNALVIPEFTNKVHETFDSIGLSLDSLFTKHLLQVIHDLPSSFMLFILFLEHVRHARPNIAHSTKIGIVPALKRYKFPIRSIDHRRGWSRLGKDETVFLKV
ncbi:hypothetical protein TIFTF001_046204 [Ficus carica]|uniref:Uncharacterized protein n=1 Tax=Ficus carica TaxID=3494 RepID=A0AA88CR91_FICCA|nr:hypothetical protein TIFTF001_046204 [Ficus carica]